MFATQLFPVLWKARSNPTVDDATTRKIFSGHLSLLLSRMPRVENKLQEQRMRGLFRLGILEEPTSAEEELQQVCVWEAKAHHLMVHSNNSRNLLAAYSSKNTISNLPPMFCQKTFLIYLVFLDYKFALSSNSFQ